jgi:2-succinyl-5-enolpyruvyl-6-hydroxy-3-cyclohexene-1-carboxylate synthase
MRAEKSALRKQEEASKALAKVEAQKHEHTTQHPKEQKVEEEEEEPEVIYRKKPPKKKRVVVVQEESSSDSEIEVRLPKARQAPPIAKPKNPDELRYDRAYNQLFSVDTL